MPHIRPRPESAPRPRSRLYRERRAPARGRVTSVGDERGIHPGAAPYTPRVTLDLARWLPEFPVRDTCLYLNHAAVSPLPRPVAAAMRSRIGEQEVSGARDWERWQQSEMAVRALTGELLHCDPSDVSLVRSTSEGLSLIAQGFPWRRGDAVLVGEEEFAANVAPYLALADRGVTVVRFPTPQGRVTVQAVAPHLKGPVRMLAVSWVSFHTGWVAEIEDLVELARDADITVVLDAIQGLGVLPATFAGLGVDALVADGHKWMLGPEGIGVMVTTPRLRARLAPVLTGWRNVRHRHGSFFLADLDCHADGRRFEPGSAPTILVAGLEAALDLLLDVGIGEIHERVKANARAITNLLLEAGWSVDSPGAGSQIAGIVAACHPFLPADEVVRRLRARSIEVSAREQRVRFSPHFYTTAGEIEALAAIVRKL